MGVAYALRQATRLVCVVILCTAVTCMSVDVAPPKYTVESHTRYSCAVYGKLCCLNLCLCNLVNSVLSSRTLYKYNLASSCFFNQEWG